MQVLLVLFQNSLLLFGLSLSAKMWTQKTTISSVIICTIAFGILFCVSTILLSTLSGQSFPDPSSRTNASYFQKVLTNRSTLTLGAIRWILETSTNMEVVKTAARKVTLVQWSRDLDPSAVDMITLKRVVTRRRYL